MSLVQQLIVSTVPRLPQQILLIALLSEAGIPQVIHIILLHIEFEFSQTPRELSVKVVLDIVGNPHIASLPLRGVLVAGLKAVDGVTHQQTREH